MCYDNPVQYDTGDYMSNTFNPEKVIDFNIDYYDVLGLKKGCLPSGTSRANKEKVSDILNRAYKSAAFKTHPDFANNDAERSTLNEKFKLVVRAHTILSNELYREYYESGGQIRPATVEQGSAFQVDWSKIGTYREGMLEDTLGNTLFLELSKRSQELNLTPAFKPSLESHNFEWDWVINDFEIRSGEIVKLAMSCVNDESDVLKLTSGKKINESLPFKIYFCIPRGSLYFLRSEKVEYDLGNNNKYILNGGLKAALYSDINLLETTSFDEAMEYISENGKIKEDLDNLKNGILLSKQKEFDKSHSQSQWLSTEEIKKYDADKLRAILLSKTFITEKNEKAADFIDEIPDSVRRKKAKFVR